MNKTVNINLGGIFFHIDEKAYLKLKGYLDAISKSLSDDPAEKEEIISDIEQRIGELLSKKTTNDRQVISEINIDEIISIMGQPEDYGYDEELFNDTSKTKKSKDFNFDNKGTKKKLFRDGEGKILGGVASGLGYYFGLDPVWIRIGLVASTLLGGAGVIGYLIMWIVTPEANSTSDYLEMKGEPVNIDNIEKKIKEEYAKIEEKVKNADYNRVKSGFQDMIDMLGKLLSGALKVLGKFIGVLLIFVASVTIISGLFGVLSWGTLEIFQIENGGNIVLPEFLEYTSIPRGIGLLILLLVIIIPFIFLFFLGINILSNKKKSLGTSGNLALLGVWILAVFGLAYSGIEYNSRFAKKGVYKAYAEHEISKKDTLKIMMKANHTIIDREDLFDRNSTLEQISIEDVEQLYSSYISIDVRRSTTDKMMFKTLYSAKSFSNEKATEIAKGIDYHYSFENNNLILDSYFLTKLSAKNNKPKVKIIIYVPDNRFVYFDNNTKDFLQRIKNKQDIYDAKMVNHTFYMNNNLECTDCKEDNSNIEEGVKVKIDENGVDFSVKDGKEKVKVKIDENGIEIR